MTLSSEAERGGLKHPSQRLSFRLRSPAPRYRPDTAPPICQRRRGGVNGAENGRCSRQHQRWPHLWPNLQSGGIQRFHFSSVQPIHRSSVASNAANPSDPLRCTPRRLKPLAYLHYLAIELYSFHMKSTGSVFRALADPTRREILQALKKKELPAGDIASMFEMSGPSVSRHLAILKAAELVAERRDGNRIIYRLEPEHLAACLSAFLSAVCPEQIFRRRKRMGK